MKRLLSGILICICILGMATGVHAKNTIVPLWDNINRLTVNITFDGTAGKASAEQVYEKDLGKVFSWTAYPPSSFQKVAMVEMNSLAWAGCVYNCTVRRGTADSTYTLANNAFSM